MNAGSTNAPTIVFLHGVGEGDPHQKWYGALDRGLRDVGYPGLESVTTIAPRYADLLHGVEDDGEPAKKLPPQTQPHRLKKHLQRDRAAYDRALAAIEQRLEPARGGKGNDIADKAASAAFAMEKFRQAKQYMTDDGTRRRVLNHIIGQLPDEGSIVLIGHSLGSVIAADLLPRLPQSLRVAGMVTIGSPLAQGNFDVTKLETDLKHPPSNLNWWINFWSGTDPVAARRGVSSFVPWVLDFKIATPLLPLDAHSAAEYLLAPQVAKAVGFAAFGSLSTELAVVDRTLTVPLNDEEWLTLLSLRYAHLIRAQLKGELRSRFTGALAEVQRVKVRGLRERAKAEGRLVPSAVAVLDQGVFATSDPAMPDRLPDKDKNSMAEVLVALAVDNPLRPYEVDVKTETRRDAMRDLCAEMGLTTPFADTTFDALEAANRALGGGGRSWVKWSFVGAGVALAAIATGGLALAPTAGAFGAAAVTSGLAAFGPGGMIGGLVTAGSLVSAGAGSIVYGVTSLASSAESVEQMVQVQLGALILRKASDLDIDPAAWELWTELERSLSREHARLREFSDSDSAALKAVSRKLSAVQAALAYSVENNLFQLPPALRD